MPLTVTIKIPKLKTFRARMRKHPQITGKHTAIAINRSIKSILDRTRPITPVDTGRLKSSFQRDSIKATSARPLGAVISKVPYAGFVHDILPAGQRYKNPTRNKQALSGFLIIGSRRAQTQVDKHFTTALKNITRELAK